MTISSSVKIEGVRELIDNLAKNAEQVKKGQREAVKAGAKVVAKELEKNVPVSDKHGNKMKDNVTVSGARKDTTSYEYYAAVGFPKGVAHRVHFPEFGSISQPPQFYFNKTIDNSWKEAQSAMIDSVRRTLG